MEYMIETYGCSMNKADSEAMAGMLEAAGFRKGPHGVLVVNTCTVKTPTERKIIRRLSGLGGRPVVVSGCIPAATPEIAERFPSFSFIGVNSDDIVEAAKASLSGKPLVRISSSGCRSNKDVKRENPAVDIIPIAQGCVGACSYCLTRFARGSLVSIGSDVILERMQKALDEGVKEFWLTAQDTGAYGLDIGEDLPHLLGRVSSIEGDFRVRVGMMNPGHVKGMLPELISAFSDERIYRFLHLPMQSGDDKVLRDMNRNYSVAEFMDVASYFREAYPELTLSTDVILGFPTEDEQAFQNTLSALESLRPQVLNISRFWERPRTLASGMASVPGRVSKQRSRQVNELFSRIGLEENKKWIGWKGRVLVSEPARDGFCARNLSYKPIIINSEEDLLGRFAEVEVVDATYYDLRARLV